MDKNIDQLAYELETISSRISDLNDEKKAKELELIEAIGQKNEGTLTRKSTFYKASTVGKVTRSFDKKVGFGDVVESMGLEAANRLVRVKLELVTSEYKNLTEKEQLELSKLITSKPAKTAVKVERLIKEDV